MKFEAFIIEEQHRLVAGPISSHSRSSFVPAALIACAAALGSRTGDEDDRGWQLFFESFPWNLLDFLHGIPGQTHGYADG